MGDTVGWGQDLAYEPKGGVLQRIDSWEASEFDPGTELDENRRIYGARIAVYASRLPSSLPLYSQV